MPIIAPIPPKSSCIFFTPLSLPAISRRFGNIDHTTSIHADRKISSLLLRDADICHDVALIIYKLTGEYQ